MTSAQKDAIACLLISAYGRAERLAEIGLIDSADLLNEKINTVEEFLRENQNHEPTESTE